MILDQLLMMADAQSLVGAPATIKCDRSIKLQTPQAIPPFGQLGGPHDLGMGRTVEVLCKIKDAVDSAGGAATVQAQLVMADEETLTTNRTVLGTSAAIAEAVLVAGYEFRCPATIPPGTTRNFIGVEFTTAGEAVTAGSVTATLPFGRDSVAFV